MVSNSPLPSIETPPPVTPMPSSGPVMLLPVTDDLALCPYRIASLALVFVVGLTMGNVSAHHARDKQALGPTRASEPVRCTPIIETIPYCPPPHVPETSPHAESILRGPSGGHPGRPEKPVFRNK